MLPDYPHNRYNPLKDEWVLVSPQRINRPWSGKTENCKVSNNKNVNNLLLPGATRASGKINDYYTSTYVFDNDFPALIPIERETICGKSDFFKWSPALGECKVMCYSPDPSLTLATMSLKHLSIIIGDWIKLSKDFSKEYEWTQIFENKGQIMGCSNPHPHCQIWTTKFLPNETLIKDKTQKSYFKTNNKSLLLAYCEEEIKEQERLIDFNDSWITLVPFWAVWPFETMVLPRRKILRFFDLTLTEIKDLAIIMKQLLTRYDNLFHCSFPYSMGWHGAPTGKHLKEDMNHWQFHGSYFPPLLRSANIQKFMVGYELLAQPQRDLTPEKAAELLRNQSNDTHYTHTPRNKDIID